MTCPNCRRVETRPGVRFCPHCGAVLPVLSQTHPTGAGFAALAQAEHPDEDTPDRPRPVLKPLPAPDTPDTPHQPWASDQEEVPIPRLQVPARSSAGASPWMLLGGCLAALSTAAMLLAVLFVLFILGVLLVCSGVRC